MTTLSAAVGARSSEAKIGGTAHADRTTSAASVNAASVRAIDATALNSRARRVAEPRPMPMPMLAPVTVATRFMSGVPVRIELQPLT